MKLTKLNKNNLVTSIDIYLILFPFISLVLSVR